MKRNCFYLMLAAFGVTCASCGNEVEGTIPEKPSVEIRLSQKSVDLKIGDSPVSVSFNQAINSDEVKIEVDEMFICNAKVTGHTISMYPEHAGSTEVCVAAGKSSDTIIVNVAPSVNDYTGNPVFAFNKSREYVISQLKGKITAETSEELVEKGGRLNSFYNHYYFENNQLIGIYTGCDITNLKGSDIKTCMKQYFNEYSASNSPYWYQRPGKFFACFMFAGGNGGVHYFYAPTQYDVRRIAKKRYLTIN